MNGVAYDGGHAVVRCKHCLGVVQARHGRFHLRECPAYQRRQKLKRVAFEKDGKKLYAIAVLRTTDRARKIWLPEMNYAHGATPDEAKRCFLAGEPDHSRVQVMQVGLAIGMFAADRDGNVLTSD